MVMSRVDERLEEISDLLNNILTEKKNLKSIKRLCINVASFQNDKYLDEQEKADFIRSLKILVEEKMH